MEIDKSLYNEDELYAPSWLDKEFLTRVLSNNEEGANIEISDYTIGPGTAKSDHYASTMFRAKINYIATSAEGSKEIKHLSLIIKTTPELEGPKKEFLEGMPFFDTEIRMYKDTLPQIEDVLRKCGDDTKLGPRLYYQSSEPRKCIILEDMALQNYTPISNRYCTIEEVKSAFSKLAKLHAVTYRLGLESDSNVTSYNKGSFNTINLEEFEVTKTAVRIFTEVLSEHDDLKIYIPYIEKVGKTLLQKTPALFNAYANGERNGIFVLNHGDFHQKNLLVRRVGEQLSDLILLDYQGSYFGSNALDVIYAFVMLMSPDMRRNHRDELFYFYFSSFQETLLRIGHTGHIPTMTEFQLELIKHRQFELFMVIATLTTVYVYADKDGDIAKVIEDENHRKALFRKKEVVQELRELLPKYLYTGYFDD